MNDPTETEKPISGVPLKEVRTRLGKISYKTVQDLINRGDLESYTIGSRRYVTEAEIARFIKARLAAAKVENESRGAKVRAAVEARQRQREAAKAATASRRAKKPEAVAA